MYSPSLYAILFIGFAVISFTDNFIRKKYKPDDDILDSLTRNEKIKLFFPLIPVKVSSKKNTSIAKYIGIRGTFDVIWILFFAVMMVVPFLDLKVRF